MEITLNEKDREYIAEQCAAKLHDKIMLALLSGAGYEHMADKVKRWVNFHTDEAMVKSVIRDEINAAVKREIASMFSQYATRDVQAMIALNGSPTWRIAQAVIELNQADLDPHALAREKTEAVRSMLLDSVEPLPLVEVVKSWHGRRPMAVGTGSESAIAEALLAHLGLRRYFDAVVAADHVKHHKPAPDTFLLCAQRMGVQPTQCVVFEDADFGIQAARAAGMDAVDVRLL